MEISHGIYKNSKFLFGFWRREVAKAIELVTDPMKMYTVEDGIDWPIVDKLTDYTGYWKKHPGDPIWFILAHKDTEGIIYAEHTLELAKRLSEITSALPGKDCYPNYQKINRKIIKGLKLANKNNEDVTFSL